jgi:uncharacterized membrane protein
LTVAFFWGISFPLMLLPIKHFGVLFFTLIMECCVFLSSYTIFVFTEKKIIPSIGNRNNGILYLLLGILVAMGTLLNNLSLTKMSVSKNILIGLFMEAITLIVGIRFFREKLKFDDWILILLLSIVFCLIAIH